MLLYIIIFFLLHDVYNVYLLYYKINMQIVDKKLINELVEICFKVS